MADTNIPHLFIRTIKNIFLIWAVSLAKALSKSVENKLEVFNSKFVFLDGSSCIQHPSKKSEEIRFLAFRIGCFATDDVHRVVKTPLRCLMTQGLRKFVCCLRGEVCVQMNYYTDHGTVHF
jgi:hypothetical protein